MSELHFEPGWTIVEDAPSPEEGIARSTVFALANGNLGLRGTPEETPAHVEGLKGCYLNGIYDTPEGRLTEREFPNFPDPTHVRIAIDGEWFEASANGVTSYRRELNMRHALVRRSVRWTTQSGVVADLAFERFVSMANPDLVVLRIAVQVDRDCKVIVVSGIDADVTNRWAHHFKTVRFDEVGEAVYAEVDTFDPGYTLGVMALNLLEVATPGERAVAADPKAIVERFQFDLPAGKAAALTKWCAVHASRFTQGNIREACRKTLRGGYEKGYVAARQAHASAWDRLWEASDVEIEGDDDALMGIRFSVFHLLAAAPYHNAKVSVPARGLQGQDYYGSVFWDCEIFVFPFLATTQPEAARNCIGYRVETLPGAKRKAEGMGFRGAYYAWQSQETGDDQCDLYVFTNPLTGEKIRSYFADEQIHISADIAYAIRQYLDATGDTGVLDQGGLEVLVEVARFFVSRSARNPETGRLEIRTVLGPDEYHERVDNNAYTNALAAHAVETAHSGLASLKESQPMVFQTFCKKHRLEESEIAQFRSFVDELFIPKPDPQTGLIEQFEGYYALRDEPIPETNARLAHPDLHKGGPLGPFQETKNIKQADVIMLLYLLRDRYNKETKRANWEYYEPRTAHDSSLSPMAYSLVAADIGMADWAYKYFIYTSHIDLGDYGPHWNHGVHTASLGGAWLAVVHGFCRLLLTSQGPKIASWPLLPEKWKAVEFRFTWHGHKMMLRVEPGLLRITNRSEQTVTVLLPDGPREVQGNASVEASFG